MHVAVHWIQRLLAAWPTTPWMHWAVVFFIPMAFFLVDKLVALSAILVLYASAAEHTVGNKLAGILLGMMEDLAITALLVVCLLVVESLRLLLSRVVVPRFVGSKQVARYLEIFGQVVRSIIVFGLVALTLAPFAADMLLLRIRDMRFTTDLIATYKREKSQASSLEVEPREIRLAVATVVGVAVVSLIFVVVFVWCVDLVHWCPVRNQQTVKSYGSFSSPSSTPRTQPSDGDSEATPTATSTDAVYVPIGDHTPQPQDAERGDIAAETETKSCLGRLPQPARVAVVVALTIVAYVVFFVVTCAIAHTTTPVIAAIALNASLNELFRNAIHVQFQRGFGSGEISSAAYYLHSDTENYELFEKDVLYRKTTGFKGPLAFDIKVEETDPPNVLIVTVESFRYVDSLYLSGNTTAGAVLAKHNLTLTPSFDKWAKRGVAFPNMWSSWQTSRSLEAILFGQIVYDSVTDSGTTHGKKDTKLSGLPQFFAQKGYETVFTTGCIVTYDQWDEFLPSHGFETVMGSPDFATIAERDYGIASGDWWGIPHRGFNWGVHDDVSFQIIGDLIVNKTKAQTDRVSRGESKMPFFHDHYTISSHTPFDSTPQWFDSVTVPDFSPMCETWDAEECETLKKYAKLRYFTDLELGKFMDRMEKAGILNDTIVVIVGDHGQSPEMGLGATELMQYQTATTHVAGALVAEGRLGKYAGLVIDDATHQYDLPNTLADIVGVPSEGFLQTSVGRSLKRKIPFGERLVWSNNPMKKMAVVQGHERFVYDRTSNEMGLFDTVDDPLEKRDLLPTHSSAEFKTWRAAGRDLSAYFKKRWDKKCLTQVECY